MGFMSDQLADGRKMRTFNVVDDFSRDCRAIEVAIGLRSPGRHRPRSSLGRMTLGESELNPNHCPQPATFLNCKW